ncbi:MAG TPA: metal ABC transporter ATP-binding protein [Spirochaetia bacterium]|nr:metal ABC transporter ATP-binding protein [Spirochaetia bacterium]
MPFLEVKNLFVSLNGNPILSDVSFALDEADFLAVVGPNGGGKTTLIRALLGLVEREAGSIGITPLPRLTPDETSAFHATGPLRIGYLPQRSSWADPLFPATVREVVASGLPAGRGLFRGGNRKRDKRTVDDALALLQIEDIAGSKVGLLSGGQQQRTHLARALVGEPSLLVLDEPTGALDPTTRSCFFKTLALIRSTRNTTIVVVTHDTHHLAGYATHILYLDRRVLFFGSTEDYQRLDEAHYFGRGHEECEP